MDVNTGMSNSMRIGGLASGIDVDEMVGKLMEAERIPLTKLKQDQERLAWKTDAFRDINTDLLDLDKIVSEMKYSKSYKPKSASTSADGAVNATANSSASDGTYDISVSQLAKGEMHAGKTGSVNADATFDAGSHTFYTYDKDGKEIEHTFEVEDGDSLQDVLKKINDEGKGNVRASYDASSERVIMETTRTGVYNTKNDKGEINFNDDFFKDSFGFDNDEEGYTVNQAQNAKFKYNGLETESKENNYTINNINFEFNKVTDGSRVTIATDVDEAYDNIKNFVDKYNDIIDKMNGSQQEKRNRDYPPLTDEQKEGMSDREIEKWEEKAKSGLLRGESSISNGMYQMRQAMQGKVETDGAYNLLSQIGITTTSDYLDGGKLEIDEDKLKGALRENPDDVYNLFVNSDKGEGRGLINKFDDALDQTRKQIEQKAGNSFKTPDNYSLGREMKQLDKRVETFEKRMEQVENRYWKQFTAMEKAISEMNQQSDYMFSQFGQQG